MGNCSGMKQRRSDIYKVQMQQEENNQKQQQDQNQTFKASTAVVLEQSIEVNHNLEALLKEIPQLCEIKIPKLQNNQPKFVMTKIDNSERQIQFHKNKMMGIREVSN